MVKKVCQPDLVPALFYCFLSRRVALWPLPHTHVLSSEFRSPCSLMLGHSPTPIFFPSDPPYEDTLPVSLCAHSGSVRRPPSRHRILSLCFFFLSAFFPRGHFAQIAQVLFVIHQTSKDALLSRPLPEDKSVASRPSKNGAAPQKTNPPPPKKHPTQKKNPHPQFFFVLPSPVHIQPFLLPFPEPHPFLLKTVPPNRDLSC